MCMSGAGEPSDINKEFERVCPSRPTCLAAWEHMRPSTASQGQMDGFFCQLLYKCGRLILRFALNSTPGWRPEGFYHESATFGVESINYPHH